MGFEPLDSRTDPQIVVDREAGFAYQVDPQPFNYDNVYLNRVCRQFSGDAMSQAKYRARVALCQRHLYGNRQVLDVGIGAGEFLDCWRKAGHDIYGYDVSEWGIWWLQKTEQWWDYRYNDLGGFDGVTCWDSIEHMADPGAFLARFPIGLWLFACLPVVTNWETLRTWQHFKPDEHPVYWTEQGFVRYMKERGFKTLEINDQEHQIGRTADIRTFVCRKLSPA